MRIFQSLAGHARRPRVAALAAALLLLLAAPAVFAGWLSINTDDGQISGGLGPAFYSSTCSDGTIANYLEIKNAWVVQDGSNFYYRLEACAQPAPGAEIQTLRIGAGLDCNNDGDVLDGFITGPEGDRKVVYWPNADQVWIYSGSNQQIIQMPNNSYGERVGASYDWRVPIDKLPPDCRASAMTIGFGFATAKMTGGSPVTQDESPLAQFNHRIDYGDATNPDPVNATCTQYPTRIGCDGARHGTESALRLGALVDGDGGNGYATNADADDLANLADEDGVFPSEGVNWVKGGSGSLTATVAGGNGYLNCWIDWNNDKDWADAGEKVLDNVAVAAGANVLPITVSGSAINFPTAYIARCRLSPGSGQGNAVTGAVEFGEVEDHNWAFGQSGNRPATVTLAASQLNPTDLRLSWTNIPSNESYLILSSAQPYFKPGDAGVTVATDPDNSTPYDVPGVIGAPADAIFYAAQGQVTTSTPDLTSALSNRVGLFEFALVKGE